MKEVKKEFFKYTSLNILGMVGLSCYILADTFFVSKGLGSLGLTSLNLAIPIYSFIHGSGLMIGMGGGIKYSILKGQGRHNEANTVFVHSFMFTVVLSMLFVFIGLFASSLITTMLQADHEVFYTTCTYLKTILLFSPMFMLNNLFICFIRNDGYPSSSMKAMLIGSFSNIILDYIFIFPMDLGIFGAAFATGLAPIISMLTLLPLFIKKKNHFSFIKCKLTIKIFFHIFTSGLPSLITEISSGIVIIVFNIIILDLSGNIGVAAYGIIANLSLVVMSIYTGIAQEIQPMISRYYGMNRYENMKSTFHYALKLMILLSIILYLFIYFKANDIVLIFNNKNNVLLQNIAIIGLRCYFTACIFVGFNIIMTVYFASKEMVYQSHIISIFRGLILIIPMAYLLSYLYGIIGVWFSFFSCEFLVCLIGIVMNKKYNITLNKKK